MSRKLHPLPLGVDMGQSGTQVFQEPSGRRWLVFKALGAVASLSLVALVAALVFDAVTPPALPRSPLHTLAVAFHAAKTPQAAAEPRAGPVSGALADAPRYGFYVNWDDNSFVSLKRHANALDVLAPEWLHLAAANGTISIDDPFKENRARTWISAHAPQLKITPLINNYSSTSQAWDGAMVANLVASEAARAQFIAAIQDNLARHGDRGLNLDFEQVPHAAMHAYAAFVGELALALHANGRTLDVSVPADDEAYPFAALAAVADHVVLMAYDEHTADDDAGPLASQGWFERTLDRRFAQIPDEKLIIGVGSYGYDWRGPGHGDELTVQEAWQVAAEAQTRVAFDPVALTPAYGYRDAQGAAHEVWFLDAASAYNQTAAALAMRPGGVALWRLGSEDPGVWSFFARGRKPDAAALREMQRIDAGYDLVYDGDGEALRVTGQAKQGSRAFVQEAGGDLILNEDVKALPEATTLTRWGARPDKVVALTFDDGPDEQWTPGVLNALKAQRAPATFFLIGGNALAHPDLVRRIVAEGHDIGSHSFTHPNIADLPDDWAKIELNTTERALEAIAGVRPLLFRPPYAEDVEPETVDDARIVELASALGYTTLGLRVDPNDWQRPGVQAIVDETVGQVERGEGHVVLLHDSGGDREETIAAIPQIVSRLRADGYRFVTAHELLGLPREALMPAAPARSPDVVLERSAFWAVSDMEAAMGGLFIAGLVLGLLRFAIIAVLATLQAARRRTMPAPSLPLPSVTVIVPAYNEEKVVVETVRSVLLSDRRDFAADGVEILVVDDGSKDATFATAQAAFANSEIVRVLTKANGGKASAINFGLAQARGDIVVIIDADTILDPAALPLLARHFEDPSVGAVAGNAKVGNRVNLLTRFQSLEYITSQNLDRRAFEAVNAISVVPGAIGAWRRSVLESVKGFATDTLAEDADATMALLRQGWRVRYEPAAIARTEAPETLKAFLKQRLRWMFGTLQAAYKHRGALTGRRSRRLGWTLLPNVLVFQVLFPLISPVMDGLLAASLVAGALNAVMHPGGALPSGLGQSILFYLLFQGIDLAGAALGFFFEKGEDWRLLPLVVVQRFCYRQLLYFTAIRALAAAVRGGVMEWGKLARTARLKAAAPNSLAGAP